MDLRDATVHTALPAPWVWSALTDVDNLEQWSGYEQCADGDERRLHLDSSWDCRLTLDGRPFAATLTVIGLDPLSSMTLRSETSVLTAVETFTVAAHHRRGGTVDYRLSAHSRVSPATLDRWLDDHSTRVIGGLSRLLHSR